MWFDMAASCIVLMIPQVAMKCHEAILAFCTSEERVGEDNYRIAVFGFGDSREYHPKQLGVIHFFQTISDRTCNFYRAKETELRSSMYFFIISKTWPRSLRTAQMTPKVKFRPIILENLSRKKALDDAWWALLIAARRCRYVSWQVWCLMLHFVWWSFPKPRQPICQMWTRRFAANNGVGNGWRMVEVCWNKS